MPWTWLRRFAPRRNSPRTLSSRRHPALVVETLEDRALMSATMIQEIVPQKGVGYTSNLTNVNGTLFFTLLDNSPQGDTPVMELWLTDGTSVGTVHLHDFLFNNTSTGPSDLTDVNGTLFFDVNGSPDQGLWKSDGTPTGTHQVAPFAFMEKLTAFKGALYFSGDSLTKGPALWKSDGTSVGTVDVQDVSIDSPLRVANGNLYFSGADRAHGAGLWRSDGTTAGTAMLKQVAPGPFGSSPYDLAAAHNTLFFGFANPLGQSELWASDGTPGGTTRLQQVVPYSQADMVDVNGTLYFLNAGPTNPGIWKSDGTPGGTSLVTPISNDADATVSMTAFQGALYYLRQSTPGGPGELWKTDGTATGTLKVATLPATEIPPSNLTNVNGTLFFTDYDAAGGFELWKSDGTVSGTMLIEDVAHTTDAGKLAIVNGTLYATVGVSHGIQVWRFDPASGPTAVAGGPYTIYAGEPVTLNGLASTGTGPLTFSWSVNGHSVQGGTGLDVLSPAALASYGVTGPGSYPISLTVSVGTSSSTSVADLIVRSPLLNVTGVAGAATEGQAFFSGVLAKFTDPARAQTLSTYNAQVDWGDGSAPSKGTVVSTPQGLVVTGGHAYAEEGTYSVTVNVAKGSGLPNSVTTTIKVGDAPFWAGREYVRAAEGVSFRTTVATITDGNLLAKAGDFKATIQWGDGQTSTGTVTTTTPGKFAVQGGHQYAMAGKYNVIVTITDVGGSTSTATSIFQVSDQLLRAVPAATFGAALPMASTPGLVAGFTDDNVLATAGQFSATIDWGDGTTSAGTIARAAGQPFFVVTGSHPYAKSGGYKVTTTIRDAGGSSLKTTLTLQAVATGSSAAVAGKDNG